MTAAVGNTVNAACGGGFVVTGSPDVTAVVCNFQFDADDALAVRMTITGYAQDITGTFHSHSTVWRYARELLAEAFMSPFEWTGEGDVQVLYNDTGAVFVIGLVADDDTMRDDRGLTHRIVIEAEPLEAFLHYAFALVPRGREVIEIDPEGLL